MPVEIQEKVNGRIIVVQAHGKLTRDDFRTFLPGVERLIERHGKIRILFDMHGFHGFTFGAVWEDIQFDIHHFRDIERLALVGDRMWEHLMAESCRLFTTGEVRYFDVDDITAAHKWIEAGQTAALPAATQA